MNIQQIEALESKIAKAKEESSRAQGSLDQIQAQAEKEFGVKTIEEATAKEAEISEQVATLSKKLDTDYQLLLADVELAVGG
jgi:outer membrane murein-binding lipoprotein Lpp